MAWPEVVPTPDGNIHLRVGNVTYVLGDIPLRCIAEYGNGGVGGGRCRVCGTVGGHGCSGDGARGGGGCAA